MIQLQLEFLLDTVLSRAQPLGDPCLRYRKGIQCSYDPVKYKGDTYCLYGTADYLLEYDAQDKAAINLVILTARKLDFKCCYEKTRPLCCGMAQIIALMCEFHSCCCP